MQRNGLVSKILAGAIITTAVGAAGTGIVANEVRNVKSHEDIRKEALYGDKEILVKVEKVNDIVTEIRLEQRELAVYLKQKL